MMSDSVCCGFFVYENFFNVLVFSVCGVVVEIKDLYVKIVIEI